MKYCELREDVDGLIQDLAQLKRRTDEADHQAAVMDRSLRRLARWLAQRRAQREREQSLG